MFQQSIQNFRVKDDINLSKAQDMVKKTGHSLALAFDGQQPSSSRPDAGPGRGRMSVKFYFEPVGSPEVSRSVLLRNVANGGRLAFIAQVIIDSGQSLPAFCRLMNLSYTRLYNALQHDDARWSQILRFSEAIGRQVVCHVYKD